MSPGLPDLLAGLAGGLSAAQAELDARAAQSLDAYDETGIPPTALAWRQVRVRVPCTVRWIPKTGPGAPSGTRLSALGNALLTVGVRYQAAPSGRVEEEGS